jgi:glycerol kinase
MAITGEEPLRSKDALTSIAWSVSGKPTYYLEAAVFVCGSALQWLRDGMRLFSNYEQLATLVDGGKGWASDLYCVPAFTGFGTPFWDARARGLIIGVTRGTSTSDVCAATLEGVAFEMNAAFRALAATAPCKRLVTDGGATASRQLMQFQTDLLQRPLDVSGRKEGTAFGAAFFAGLESGFWPSVETLRQLAPPMTEYQPKLDAKTATHIAARWQEAAQRSLQWAEK